MTKRASYTVAMRDWSPALDSWLWVCVPSAAPPRQPALQWAELTSPAPGVKVWRKTTRPEQRVIDARKRGDMG
jgi:hypothetical protein